MIGSQTEERVRVTLLAGVLDTLHYAAYEALSVYYFELWMEMANFFLESYYVLVVCSVINSCQFSHTRLVGFQYVQSNEEKAHKVHQIRFGHSDLLSKLWWMNGFDPVSTNSLNIIILSSTNNSFQWFKYIFFTFHAFCKKG